MNVGDWIELKGKTLHGKNRINEHGNLWLIKEIRGNSLSLRSKDKTFKIGTEFIHDGRWVEIKNDKNFEII